jgi:ATP-dependent RNA helicase DDX23/PRP28
LPIANPLRSWSEAEIPKRILDIIRSIGYSSPTPIQRQAIPVSLGIRDLIGIAMTGSGKTAAFVIPIVSFICDLLFDNQADDSIIEGPFALVLCPTRELAQQIETEVLKFAKPFNIKSICLVGGHSIDEQFIDLRNGVDIVIATPGRLLDCLERKMLVCNNCSYVVMDECDKYGYFF